MEQELESGYHALRETVEKYLNHSSYAIISLGEIFSDLLGTVKHTEVADIEKVQVRYKNLIMRKKKKRF